MSGAIAAGVALTVDGQVHRGWTSCKVSLGLDAAAAEISLQLAERWAIAFARPKLAAGQDREPHHVRAASLGAEQKRLVGGQRHAVRKSQALRDDLG